MRNIVTTASTNIRYIRRNFDTATDTITDLLKVARVRIRRSGATCRDHSRITADTTVLFTGKAHEFHVTCRVFFEQTSFKFRWVLA